MNKLLILICGVVLLALGMFLFPDYFPVKDGSQEQVAATASSTGQRVPPKGWLEYRNSRYRISLFYPEDLSVSEVDEGKAAMTITFQNAKDVKGFQMFVLPYSGVQVSEERFKQDVPSGVRTDLADIEVDGATGAAFYSNDVALGETYEVWFIRRGYLYEVTTLKPLDTWLSDIMQSWKFL